MYKCKLFHTSLVLIRTETTNTLTHSQNMVKYSCTNRNRN